MDPPAVPESRPARSVDHSTPPELPKHRPTKSSLDNSNSTPKVPNSRPKKESFKPVEVSEVPVIPKSRPSKRVEINASQGVERDVNVLNNGSGTSNDLDITSLDEMKTNSEFSKSSTSIEKLVEQDNSKPSVELSDVISQTPISVREVQKADDPVESCYENQEPINSPIEQEPASSHNVKVKDSIASLTSDSDTFTIERNLDSQVENADHSEFKNAIRSINGSDEDGESSANDLDANDNHGIERKLPGREVDYAGETGKVTEKNNEEKILKEANEETNEETNEEANEEAVRNREEDANTEETKTQITELFKAEVEQAVERRVEEEPKEEDKEMIQNASIEAVKNEVNNKAKEEVDKNASESRQEPNLEFNNDVRREMLDTTTSNAIVHTEEDVASTVTTANESDTRNPSIEVTENMADFENDHLLEKVLPHKIADSDNKNKVESRSSIESTDFNISNNALNTNIGSSSKKPELPKTRPNKVITPQNSETPENTTKKAPPRIPKKPSSKIAAFQEMLQQQQNAALGLLHKATPKVPLKRPSATSIADENNIETDSSNGPIKSVDKAQSDFAHNLNGLLGVGLPGIALGTNPYEALKQAKKITSEETPKVSDARRSRAKGPRGRKLPGVVKKPIEVTDETLGNTLTITVQSLWSINFGDISNEIKTEEIAELTVDNSVDVVDDEFIPIDSNISSGGATSIEEKKTSIDDYDSKDSTIASNNCCETELVVPSSERLDLPEIIPAEDKKDEEAKIDEKTPEMLVISETSKDNTHPISDILDEIPSDLHKVSCKDIESTTEITNGN